MKKITFVKIGGSLITDKNKPYTVNPENLKLVCSEISKVIHERPDLHLVLANGVGSFAHTSAKKYDTMHGFNTDEGRFGCAKVMYDALEINKIFVEQLLAFGLPAIHFQTSAIMIAKNGIHKSEYINSLINVVERGLIPVLYGDVIVDEGQGSTIYSADKTIPILARKFDELDEYEVNRFINIGNYDGVWDDQKNLLPEINSKNIDKVRTYFYDDGKVDVTGGMATKVEELYTLAKMGIDSHIVNGSINDRTYLALTEKEVIGTKITK